MEIALINILHDKFGEVIDYLAENNGNGTYKLTLKYNGYYDNNGLFHQRSVYIVLPCTTFNPNNDLTVKESKLYYDLNILNYINLQAKDDKILFQIIVPDDMT